MIVKPCVNCGDPVQIENDYDEDNSVNVICEDCAHNMVPYDNSAYNSIFETGEENE